MKVFVALTCLAMAAVCHGFSNTRDPLAMEQQDMEPINTINTNINTNMNTDINTDINSNINTNTPLDTEMEKKINIHTDVKLPREEVTDETLLQHLSQEVSTLEEAVERHEEFLATRYASFAMQEGPVHGGFSTFSDWTPCTKACGGQAFRFRHCTSPAPRNGGRPCTGHTTEVKTCPNTCYRHSRLVDGPSPSAGRLEVLVDNQWTSVCHNNFTVTDARVVCRNLGFTQTPLVLAAAHFGHGDSRKILMDLQCQGAEKDLFHCAGIHNQALAIDGRLAALDISRNPDSPTCSHVTDVAIDCQPSLARSIRRTTPLVMTGLRLVEGDRTTRGRLEVQANRTMWGTVCDDHFDTRDAIVACRTLDLIEGIEPVLYKNTTSTHLPRIPILLDDVRCQGTETELDVCRHRPLGHHSCHHYEDVSVDCRPTLKEGTEPICPRGFIHHKGFCYKMMTDKLSKPEATKRCMEYNAHLIEIRDYNQSQFITDLLATKNLKPTGLWMGLHTTVNEAKYELQLRFDTDNREVDMTKFIVPHTLQTSQAVEDDTICAKMTYEGYWDFEQCQTPAQFFCQAYGKVPSTTPETENFRI